MKLAAGRHVSLTRRGESLCMHRHCAPGDALLCYCRYRSPSACVGLKPSLLPKHIMSVAHTLLACLEAAAQRLNMSAMHS